MSIALHSHEILALDTKITTTIDNFSTSSSLFLEGKEFVTAKPVLLQLLRCEVKNDNKESKSSL